MGRGQVRSDDPQFFNRVRKEAMGKCDVFVLAGSPLDFRLGFGRSIPADAEIIQLDMENSLIGQNRSPDVAIVGNLGLAFERLLEVMKEESIQLDFTTWRDELRGREAEIGEGFEAQLNSDESPVDPLRMAREIREFIDENTILIGDGGDIVAQSSKVIPVYRENCWMDPGPLGTLGVGMPFALAAKASFPDRKVLIIYGDGSFGLNGFEYDTAIRHDLPIVGIVGNDAAWGSDAAPAGGPVRRGAGRGHAPELHAVRQNRRGDGRTRRVLRAAGRDPTRARTLLCFGQAGTHQCEDSPRRGRHEGQHLRLTKTAWPRTRPASTSAAHGSTRSSCVRGRLRDSDP